MKMRQAKNVGDTVKAENIIHNESKDKCENVSSFDGFYRVTGNAQILEKALFPKLKLTKDLN